MTRGALTRALHALARAEYELEEAIRDAERPTDEQARPPADEFSVDFGDAIKMLRDGKHVRRDGWHHGPTAYLVIVGAADGPTGIYPSLPSRSYIVLRDEHALRVPWTPTHVDLLADDWRACDGSTRYYDDERAMEDMAGVGITRGRGTRKLEW